MPKCDFSGYATKVNLRCTDGRKIRKDAFSVNDGETVPLVWQHQRNDPENILGHALLENRADGVYAYCSFNDTPKAQHMKSAVAHGDITRMSIYANQLQQAGADVVHGCIREVSLVVAGANPGALIDNLQIQHADGSITDLDDEAVIYTGLNLVLGSDGDISHADDSDNDSSKSDTATDKNTSGSGKTAKEIFESMNEDQKTLLYAMVGAAMSKGGIDDEDDSDEAQHYDEEGDDPMKVNVFEGQSASENGKYVLTHEDQEMILEDAKQCKSFKLALEHFCEEHELEHGVTDLEILFPEAKLQGGAEPEMLTRPMEWVSQVWNGFKKSPMSRIKWMYADLTKDEARAKGYIKGHRKVEEQFSLLKRTTSPTTVYKKQKFDRDDIIDIVDFNFIAWIQREMRMMLNEELSRAALIGDGREVDDEDKIDENCIRPIYKEDEMYAIHYDVGVADGATAEERATAIVEGAVRSRKDYRGSGNPTFFTTTDVLNDLMLQKDKNGRRIYATQAELAAAMRVANIVEIPVMENIVRTDKESKTHALLGIIVNLSDYTIGADRGGAVTMFDDFDIDYNKQTYLIETRLSGALNKPYSAIILEQTEKTAPVTLTVKVDDGTEDRYGKKATELQNNVLMGSDFICGKLRYIHDYTNFSDDTNLQSGHYLALTMEATQDADIYTQVIGGKDSEKKVADGWCVYYIRDPEKQKIRVTAKKNGSVVAQKIYSLTNLFLA